MRSLLHKVLFPNSTILGVMATERASLSGQSKCEWASREIDPSDPYLTAGAGLFERHSIPYPKNALHVGMWKFEEADDYECLVGRNLYGVEANPVVFELYSKKTAQAYGFNAYNFAAGDTDIDSIDIYFDPSRMDCSNQFDRTLPNVVSVQQRRLEGFIEEVGIDFEFLNIDAEGSELKILKGLGDKINSINSMIIETSLHDIHRSGSSLDLVNEFLKSNGFDLIEIDSKFIMPEYGWGDAFFSRR